MTWNKHDRSAAFAAEQAQGADGQESDGAGFGDQGEGGGDVGVEADRRAGDGLAGENAAVVLGELDQVREVDLAVIVEVAVVPPGFGGGVGNEVAAVVLCELD